MPVEATPSTPLYDNSLSCPGSANPLGNTVPVSLSTCLGQSVVVSNTPRDSGTGTPVLSRIRAVNIYGGRDVTIKWNMLDSVGNTVNLAECVCPENQECAFAIKLFITEYMGFRNSAPFDAVVTDPSKGEISIDIPKEVTNGAGVYFAEVVVFNADNPVFSNQFYLVINRSILQQGPAPLLGPPSVAEVRLHLRDSGAAESYLLDNVKFSDEEIAHCIYLPVAYWNEIPPPIGFYDTLNFPFRYHWLEAISGYLFRIVGEQQRANNIQYAAGGIQVNDQNKEPNYEQAAKIRLDEYKKFVREKKIEINIANGFLSVNSGYRSRRIW